MISDIVKLTEFTLGLDTRIGTPDEHISGNVTEEMKHPMHATGIGLVLKGFQIEDESRSDRSEADRKAEEVKPDEKQEETSTDETVEKKQKKSGVVEKLNEFLRKIISDGRY